MQHVLCMYVCSSVSKMKSWIKLNRRTCTYLEVGTKVLRKTSSGNKMKLKGQFRFSSARVISSAGVPPKCNLVSSPQQDFHLGVGIHRHKTDGVRDLAIKTDVLLVAERSCMSDFTPQARPKA